jgi:glutaredoxin
VPLQGKITSYDCDIALHSNDLLFNQVLELDVLEDGPALRSELGKLTGIRWLSPILTHSAPFKYILLNISLPFYALLGRTSVPAIWINGQFVGGCNDGPMGGINQVKESGKLEGMLKDAGALGA